ncbi:MAG: hypothetical protein ACOC6J_11235, partial [Spirochaetota bacterium]
MIASAATVPVSAIYLILVFFQGFGPVGPIDVDYLEAGVPTLAVSAAPEEGGDGRVYRIAARPAAISGAEVGRAPEASTVRVEQSELASQNYLIHDVGRSLPVLLTLEPVLAQLASASNPRDLTLELPGQIRLEPQGLR